MSDVSNLSDEVLNRPVPASGEPHLIIVIRRTITVEMKIPLTKGFYPDEPTIRHAIDYERNLPDSEKVQLFVEQLEGGDSDSLDLGETIRVEVPHQK